ncbi:Chlorophyllase-2, chloroplastic [Dichanthelium oligosanthes]|uniref:Chlorophyllase-2, chloroplastic n=1 Tax=Dichanthelium oligosanthes TaxID=888268 RepID=A0A1E5W4B3_9POAL|nr:Chlorophyllase-2, chloroplastic [Dichanthelium oligosanthes]
MDAASAVLLFLAHCLLLHRCMGSEAGGVFDQGRHGVSLSRVDEARAPWRCGGGTPSTPGAGTLPPKPLLVAAPREAGEYPVLVFLHGYLVVNSFYSQLFQHIASHGFIVVAPQLYTISGPDTTEEINAAAAVIGWLAGGLSSALPPGVRADLTKVSVSGHSRGGKVAFALALSHAKLALPLAALVAVDPVDGMGVGKQTPPPILTGRSRSLRVSAPTLVIGTGLGELPRGPLLPPCAPLGVSHAAFYDELDCAAAPPTAACHLVARDYGHTDMMDDDTPGARGMLTRMICRSGGDRAPMRRFVGGATVAFLNKWVGGDGAALDGIRACPEQSPVGLSVVEFLDDKATAPIE